MAAPLSLKEQEIDNINPISSNITLSSASSTNLFPFYSDKLEERSRINLRNFQADHMIPWIPISNLIIHKGEDNDFGPLKSSPTELQNQAFADLNSAYQQLDSEQAEVGLPHSEDGSKLMKNS